MKLYAPESFLKASDELKASICNGTGASGTPKWIVWLLDSIFGLGINFSKASDIHDWMYFHRIHWYGKLFADWVFFHNMCMLSTLAIFQLPLSAFIGNLAVFPLRIIRAFFYFIAVLLFGWKPFYKK